MNEDHWKKSETDRMLSLYLLGTPTNLISESMQRPAAAIIRRIARFLEDKERILAYEPVQRHSRTGSALTALEAGMIAAHRRLGVPAVDTARVLARKVAEVQLDPEAKLRKLKEKRVLAPTLDLILALHYIYHVYDMSIVSNAEYDSLVTEEVEYGGGSKALSKMREPNDAPPYIKSLALYLAEKFKEEGVA